MDQHQQYLADTEEITYQFPINDSSTFFFNENINTSGLSPNLNGNLAGSELIQNPLKRKIETNGVEQENIVKKRPRHDLITVRNDVREMLCSKEYAKSEVLEQVLQLLFSSIGQPLLCGPTKQGLNLLLIPYKILLKSRTLMRQYSRRKGSSFTKKKESFDYKTRNRGQISFPVYNNYANNVCPIYSNYNQSLPYYYSPEPYYQSTTTPHSQTQFTPTSQSQPTPKKKLKVKKPKSSISKKVRNLPKSNKDLYCICHQPYNGKDEMVECTSTISTQLCNGWVHPECFNINDTQLKRIISNKRNYTCTLCKWDEKGEEIDIMLVAQTEEVVKCSFCGHHDTNLLGAMLGPFLNRKNRYEEIYGHDLCIATATKARFSKGHYFNVARTAREVPKSACSKNFCFAAQRNCASIECQSKTCFNKLHFCCSKYYQDKLSNVPQVTSSSSEVMKIARTGRQDYLLSLIKKYKSKTLCNSCYSKRGEEEEKSEKKTKKKKKKKR